MPEIIPLLFRNELEWIIFYETIGGRNVTYTSKYFGISRKTFHKWYGVFKHSHHKLETLMDRSKAPKKVRGWEVTPDEEDLVYKLRKAHNEIWEKEDKKALLSGLWCSHIHMED